MNSKRTSCERTPAGNRPCLSYQISRRPRASGVSRLSSFEMLAMLANGEFPVATLPVPPPLRSPAIASASAVTVEVAAHVEVPIGAREEVADRVRGHALSAESHKSRDGLCRKRIELALQGVGLDRDTVAKSQLIDDGLQPVFGVGDSQPGLEATLTLR